MKQLTCEMCGSTDLVKQDGIFVCQSCGCKYSVEEAKKMMIEGTVDVSGSTVKVDNSALVENYMTMAKNAYTAKNLKEAEDYCNKIIEIDPKNAEAWLVKGVAAAWQSTLANVRMDEFVTDIGNAFKNATSVDALVVLGKQAKAEYSSLSLAINKLIIDNIINSPVNLVPAKWTDYLNQSQSTQALVWGIQIQAAYINAFNNLFTGDPDKEDQRQILFQESDSTSPERVQVQCKSQIIDGAISLWNASLSRFRTINNGFPNDYDMVDMLVFHATTKSMLKFIVPVDTSAINEIDKPNIVRACKQIIAIETTYMGLKAYEVTFAGGVKSYQVSKILSMEAKQEATNEIRRSHNIIKECDPTYTVPTVPDPQPPKSGCYVATAVYGSYDCPQVWTLRRYRDYVLAETWYGRAFIHTYYAISPTLVKWFGKTRWFKKLWKGKLDRLVAKLQHDGFEATPYKDKQW